MVAWRETHANSSSSIRMGGVRSAPDQLSLRRRADAPSQRTRAHLQAYLLPHTSGLLPSVVTPTPPTTLHTPGPTCSPAWSGDAAASSRPSGLQLRAVMLREGAQGRMCQGRGGCKPNDKRQTASGVRSKAEGSKTHVYRTNAWARARASSVAAPPLPPQAAPRPHTALLRQAPRLGTTKAKRQKPQLRLLRLPPAITPAPSLPRPLTARCPRVPAGASATAPSCAPPAAAAPRPPPPTGTRRRGIPPPAGRARWGTTTGSTPGRQRQDGGERGRSCCVRSLEREECQTDRAQWQLQVLKTVANVAEAPKFGVTAVDRSDPHQDTLTAPPGRRIPPATAHLWLQRLVS